VTTLNPVFVKKARRVIARKADALFGQFLDKTIEAMCLRPFELYRSSEGRERAKLNVACQRGEVVKRGAAGGPFSGG
jgi:hypothetical protein